MSDEKLWALVKEQYVDRWDDYAIVEILGVYSTEAQAKIARYIDPEFRISIREVKQGWTLDKETPAKPHMREVDYLREDGFQRHHIDRGTHTLLFDLRRMRQSAVGDFIQKIIGLNESSVQHNPEIQNMVACAVGYFQVPLADFYPDVKDEFELDDATLGKIVKWGKIREEAEKAKAD